MTPPDPTTQTPDTAIFGKIGFIIGVLASIRANKGFTALVHQFETVAEAEAEAQKVSAWIYKHADLERSLAARDQQLKDLSDALFEQMEIVAEMQTCALTAEEQLHAAMERADSFERMLTSRDGVDQYVYIQRRAIYSTLASELRATGALAVLDTAKDLPTGQFCAIENHGLVVAAMDAHAALTALLAKLEGKP